MQAVSRNAAKAPLPHSFQYPLTECGVRKYNLSHILQRQPVGHSHRKLADHISGPGTHHLGAQDAV